MQKKTYLVLGIGVALYFLPHMQNKAIFFLMVIISSILPDTFSFIPLMRRKKIRFSNDETIKPNDFLHTYTVCVIVSIALTIVYPLLAFPFFIGYSFHLALDSFSVRGIKPFWPFKKVSAGPINPGGKTEKTVFVMLLLFDIALLLKIYA